MHLNLINVLVNSKIALNNSRIMNSIMDTMNNIYIYIDHLAT